MEELGRVAQKLEETKITLDKPTESSLTAMKEIFSKVTKKGALQKQLEVMGHNYKDFLKKMRDFLQGIPEEVVVHCCYYDVLQDKFVEKEDLDWDPKLLDKISYPLRPAEMEYFGFYAAGATEMTKSRKISEWCQQKHFKMLRECLKKFIKNGILSPEEAETFGTYWRERINQMRSESDEFLLLKVFSEFQKEFPDCIASVSSESASSPASVGLVSRGLELASALGMPSTSSTKPTQDAETGTEKPPVLFSKSAKPPLPSLPGETPYEIVSNLQKSQDLEFGECACHPALKRLPQGDARGLIEDLILQDLLDKKIAKDKPITITEIGSGELKQTAVLACKLLQAGYSVRFNLYDIIYKDKDKKNKDTLKNKYVAAFLKLLEQLNQHFPGKASIASVSTEHNYWSTDPSNYLLMIDVIDYAGKHTTDSICEREKQKNPDIVTVMTKKIHGLLTVYKNDQLITQYDHRKMLEETSKPSSLRG